MASIRVWNDIDLSHMGILGKYSGNIQGVFKEWSGNDGLKLVLKSILVSFKAKSKIKLWP